MATLPDDPRLIDVEVPHQSLSLQEFDGYTLAEAIESLRALQAAHPGRTLVLKVQGVAWEDYQHYAVYERRRETPEEVRARQAAAAMAAAAREAHDRATFEALARRFGAPADR